MKRPGLRQLLAEQAERAEFLACQVHDLAQLVEKIKRAEPMAYWRALRAALPPVAIRDARQAGVYAWAVETFGEIATEIPERVQRLLEEAVELAQAEGLDEAEALRLVYHVYGKPAGEPQTEAAQVGVCLLAYCEAAGVSADAIEAAEVARAMALPAEHFRARQNAKAAAGVAGPADPAGAEEGRGVGALIPRERKP